MGTVNYTSSDLVHTLAEDGVYHAAVCVEDGTTLGLKLPTMTRPDALRSVAERLSAVSSRFVWIQIWLSYS